jgi:hypothetical protein
MINFVPHTYETMGVEIVFSHYIFVLALFWSLNFFFNLILLNIFYLEL